MPVRDPHRPVPCRPRWLPLAFGALLLFPAACKLPWEGKADTGPLTVSGTIEAHEVPVAFQVPGRIQALAADEGDAVAKGAPLADLDPADLEIALARARAEAAAAQAALAELEAGSRPQEIRVARAAVGKAEADLTLAGTERDRLRKMVPAEAAAQSRLDQAEATYAVAEAALAQARENLTLREEGPRKEEIDRARATLAAARAATAAATRDLGHARLTSPAKGVVTARLAEAGQVVSPGEPVLRVAELDRPWVRAYVAEPDLPRVRLGEPAEVRVDGLPGRTFQGRLAFIAPNAEFTPKVVETKDLRVDLVFRIKVEVENPDGALKIGMPADVTLTPAAAAR
jgi:HlyD family secretion protein